MNHQIERRNKNYYKLIFIKIITVGTIGTVGEGSCYTRKCPNHFPYSVIYYKSMMLDYYCSNFINQEIETSESEITCLPRVTQLISDYKT